MLHRRAAELLRDEPERAAAEPELIAHHFTEAGLDDLAIEWWGKAGDQALRRSAFQEAIAHLGKAIAMADKAEGGRPAGASGERPQLHVAHGNALIAARGYGAAETTAAFARARESALGDEDAPERLAADYGLWAGSYVRGELSAMRAHAETFLKDVEARPEFARGRGRSPHCRNHELVRRRVCRSARDFWNTRWPSSNPAATTIWPFASDTTRALRRCFISRSLCGRSATSGARFPSSATLRRGLRTSPMSARAHYGETLRGHDRADASRYVSRRNERRRTRPTHARA